ncbi:hypothetical protein Tco_1533488 [Tanacetum coccineum]
MEQFYECLTVKNQESKAYKTYLGYAIGEVPPMVAKKIKKASPSNKESELVPGDEEPVKKGKRLKTPAKKKEKEKGGVDHGKGIELMSEKAQMKEARMKSLRDFHKTHPSGSGTVAGKHSVKDHTYCNKCLVTARIKEQVKDQLPQILPQEVSNFAPPVIEKLIKESRDEVTLAKV